MHISVTGGAGFIGSAHVHALLQDDVASDSFTVLDPLSCSGNGDNCPQTPPRLRFVRGDITDDRPVRELLPGHDVIAHFAAESPVDRSIAGAIPFVHRNVPGTQVLLDAAGAVGTGRFVHVPTGPAATVAWYRDNRSWCEPSKARETV